MNFKKIVILAGLTASLVHAGQREQRPLLGSAYNDETETVLSQVLVSKNNPPILYAGQQESSIQIKYDLSLDDLLTELNIKTSAGFSIGIFSVSGGVDFLSHIAKTELSTNVVYTYDIRGKSALFNGVTLTDIAIGIIKSRNVEDKDEFFGNYFINQVDLGGKLIAAVSLNFANKNSKSAFQAKFKMDLLDFLKANAEGGVKYDQLASSASINISARQIGGDPTKLSEIFKSKTNDSVPVVNCRLDDLKPCHEVLKAIIEYGKNFGEQLKNLEYNPVSSTGAAIIGAGKARYSSYGIVEVDRNSSLESLQEIKTRRELLSKKYLELSQDRTRITKLIGLLPSDKERVRLEALQKNIENSITDILETIEVCYNTPGICLDKDKQLKIFSYSKDEISFEWTFYNYCQFVHDSHSILATVERVRQMFPDGQNLSCSELQSQLEKRKFLDLSFSFEKRKISDLRPLSGLTKLRKVILDGNDIHSFYPLESNKDLEILRARSNAFSQFPELCAFSKLRSLDLEFNSNMHIEGHYDINCVEELPNLEFLNVRGAQFESKKSIHAFVQSFEKHTKVKRYESLFTSNEDVCEGVIRYQHKRGWIDNEDADYCRRKKTVFDSDSEFIGIPCNDKVEVQRFDE